MYRRIMVVTGDQAWSNAPVKYATALAAETGAELAILMVLTPPLIAGSATLRFQARPVHGGGPRVSEPFPVHPGDTLTWVIPPP